MGYEYDYDDAAARAETRVLWGRVAALGVGIVVVFALGTWWGGRGATDEEQIVALEEQVESLQETNRELQDTIDALSAGEPEQPEPADNDEGDASGDDNAEEANDGGDAAEGQGSAEPETRTYLVQPGDTLRGIARDVYGDPDRWDVIADANGLTRETVLTVGQELVIPPLDG